MNRRVSRLPYALTAVLLAGACDGGPVEPELPPRLVFSTVELDLGETATGHVELRNLGGRAVGPVELAPGSVQDRAGATVPGTRLVAEPVEIPTLNPGDVRSVALSVSLPGTLHPGAYDAVLRARAGEHVALLPVRFVVAAGSEAEAASVALVGGPHQSRTGDVVPLRVEVRSAGGALLQGVGVGWSVTPADAGLVGPSGQFVGYRVGSAQIVARVGDAADTAVVVVRERGVRGSFAVASRARELTRYSSDLWLHGDVAYVGTWGARRGEGEAVAMGNTLHVWNVASPRLPIRAFSIEVDARTVNDVKIRADGRLALLTHEGSNDGLNGVTLLDLTAPLRPRVVGRFTTGLESGVHNAWLEGDYAYLVVDGVGSGLRVLDVGDPARPRVVASYYAGSSFLHDVYVRDGLAFLSHWNAGLVILDVGHGIAGGTPEAPVEVSRLESLGGQTHNAWYWPEAGYVFVGEEDFSAPGIMHVVDVRNLRSPREVATYAVPGQTPHNFWLDESRGVLYLAWYGMGLRALDVTGDLLGELHRQDREIAGFLYNGGGGSCNRPSTDTCTWAPQLHRGLVWVSDINEGLVALEPPR